MRTNYIDVASHALFAVPGLCLSFPPGGLISSLQLYSRFFPAAGHFAPPTRQMDLKPYSDLGSSRKLSWASLYFRKMDPEKPKKPKIKPKSK